MPDRTRPIRKEICLNEQELNAELKARQAEIWELLKARQKDEL